MRKIFVIFGLLFCALCQAQTGAAEHASRYERQARAVGPAGLGVETILDRWEADFPDDPALMEARYKFWLAKSLTTTVAVKPTEKYLGNAPVVVLKDSTGADVRYFEENVFVDSLFARSQTAIDRAVALAPQELAYRVDKITSLMLYEKDSPDLATIELLSLIDYNKNSKPSWVYYGLPVDEDTFVATVQEYCFNFYKYGTPGSYEAFRTVSEAMLKSYPSNVEFMNNLGSYWLVYKQNPGKALKWYNKVLKLDPSNYNAAKNCVVLARKSKNTKLEKKYLPMLIQATSSETEKMTCQARLEALQTKKK